MSSIARSIIVVPLIPAVEASDPDVQYVLPVILVLEIPFILESPPR